MALLVLMAGLSIEVNRILDTRQHMRHTLRQAALVAVTQLDGTAEGLRRASLLAGAAAPNLLAVRLDFAPGLNGPWMSNPGSAANLRYVRAAGQQPAHLPLLRLMVGRNAETVWTTAAAEQIERRSFTSGLFPYAVVAHHPDGPSYGLTAGNQYALRWPDEVRPESVCAGDRAPSLLAQLAGHPRRRLSFLEIADPVAIRRAFLEDQQTIVRLLGDQATFSSGNRTLELDYLGQRIRQDTDAASTTYAQYTRLGRGNGRRLVVAPLRSNDKDQIMLATAAFFLLPAASYSADPNRAFCAEYVGSFMEGSRTRAAAPNGYFVAAAVL